MKLKTLENETSVKVKLINFSPLLIIAAVARNKYWNLEISVSKKMSKTCRHSFLQTKKIELNQLIDLKNYLERYCSVLPVFSFNSAKYDINLIESYLLPLLVNERDFESILI